MLNYVFSFLVGFCLFIFGVTFGHYKYPPFSLLKEFKDSFTQVPESKINQPFEVCELPVVNQDTTYTFTITASRLGFEPTYSGADSTVLSTVNSVSKSFTLKIKGPKTSQISWVTPAEVHL